MSSLKKITIFLTNIEKLSHAFKLSAELDENAIINFTISDEGFIGIVKSSNDSCYKTWSLKYDETFIKNEKLDAEIKCSIYKGNDFISKILGHFTKHAVVKLTFSYDDVLNSVKMIQVEGFNKGEKKSALTFNLISANSSIYFQEFDEELLDMLFNDKNENIELLLESSLESSEIKELKTLNNFQANDELQKSFLKFKIVNDQLVITDNTFTRTYAEKVVTKLSEITESIDLQKALFKFLTVEYQSFSIKKFEDNFLITFIAEKSEANEKTTFLLLKEIDMSIDYEDVFNDSKTFGQ